MKKRSSKEWIIRILIYLAVGFAAAYLFHLMRT
jgi:hypothetical protein